MTLTHALLTLAVPVLIGIGLVIAAYADRARAHKIETDTGRLDPLGERRRPSAGTHDPHASWGHQEPPHRS